MATRVLPYEGISVRTLVREFMTTSVSTVNVNTPLCEVAQHMVDSRISCLLVVDNGPVGIITDRDFTRIATKHPEQGQVLTLADVISGTLISISPEAETRDALSRMTKHRLRRLLVKNDNGDICGIITQTDLLRAHNHVVECQMAELEGMVAARTLDLEKSNAKLELLTLTDPMLMVGNRRAMDLALEAVLNNARRYKRPYSVLLVDVDKFKPYNDHYGHQKGDEILTTIATTIQSTIRCTDSVYRYGGEEFLVLLPETPLPGAAIAAEHVRAAIETLAIEHELSDRQIVTISIGVAEENLDCPNINKTIQCSDNALYIAKEKGRNKVIISDGSITTDIDHAA